MSTSGTLLTIMSTKRGGVASVCSVRVNRQSRPSLFPLHLPPCGAFLEESHLAFVVLPPLPVCCDILSLYVLSSHSNGSYYSTVLPTATVAMQLPSPTGVFMCFSSDFVYLNSPLSSARVFRSAAWASSNAFANVRYGSARSRR